MKVDFKIILVTILIMFISVSCEYKDLCYNHDEHAMGYKVYVYINFETEWEYPKDSTSVDIESGWVEDEYGFPYDSLRPSIPDGIRVLLYDKEHIYRDKINVPAGGGRFLLPDSISSMLFYNNDTEYILFNDKDSPTAATATTRTRTRSTYFGNSLGLNAGPGGGDIRTVNPPDMLYGKYIPDYEIVRKVDPDSINVKMVPLVYKYLIRYKIDKGIKYVRMARGALEGMAGSVYLYSGSTTNEVVTVMYDCVMKKSGAEAYVNSFGIPNYPNDAYTRGDANFALNLELMLNNGKLLTYEFDVTDQVERQPHGGIINVGNIEVPDSIGLEGSTGGFEIEVDGWGEYEDIELPL